MSVEEDKNTVVWVLAAAVVILLLFGGFGMGGNGMMGSGMGFGFLFMLLFFGAIIWLLDAIVDPARSGRDEGQDALTILKKRYAKGEITKKQYEKMKKELS